jgi:hypothetical protein
MVVVVVVVVVQGRDWDKAGVPRSGRRTSFGRIG